MYFSGVVFVQSKMAEQIFTRKGEAIEPWIVVDTQFYENQSLPFHMLKISDEIEVETLRTLVFTNLFINYSRMTISHSNIHLSAHLQCLFRYL